MAELKIRQLSDRIVAALKARARRRGVSLEEELRSTLTASVTGRRKAFARRAAGLRAACRPPEDPALDSARLIRRDRDAWG